MSPTAANPPHGGVDQRSDRDLGIEVEISDRGTFEHRSRRRVGQIERRGDLTAGFGHGAKRPEVDLVVEQRFDERGRDRVPVLEQHRERHELGALVDAAPRRRG